MSGESIEFVKQIGSLGTAGQAKHFLNAKWSEIESQADFIYNVTVPTFEKFKSVAKKGAIELGDLSKFLEHMATGSISFQYCKKLSDDKKKQIEPSLAPIVGESALDLKNQINITKDGYIDLIEYLLRQYNINSDDYMKVAKHVVQPKMGLEAAEKANVTQTALDAYYAEIAGLEKAMEEASAVKRMGIKLNYDNLKNSDRERILVDENKKTQSVLSKLKDSEGDWLVSTFSGSEIAEIEAQSHGSNWWQSQK